MNKKYDIVKVKWMDSASQGRQDWHLLSDHDHSIVIVTSVGHLIYEDDQIITLVLSLSTEAMIVGDMTIPKACILKRKKLA